MTEDVGSLGGLTRRESVMHHEYTSASSIKEPLNNSTCANGSLSKSVTCSATASDLALYSEVP